MPPRPRAGLTRDRVLATALDIVDRDGIDALSMRRLGRELGVEAMSLYSYVESKQDLIEGVVEQVFREMPIIIEGGGPWQDRLRDQAGTFRRVLLAHPHTITLVAGRPLVTDRTRAFVESALVELQRYGLDLMTADLVLGLIASFVIGHVSEQVGEDSRTAAGYVTVEPEGSDAVRFPNVTALVKEIATDRDREFAFGLDVLIAGISGLLPADDPKDSGEAAGA